MSLFLCVYVEGDRDREHAPQGDRDSAGTVQPQRAWSQQALGLRRRGTRLVFSTTVNCWKCLFDDVKNVYIFFLGKETILPCQSLREDPAEQLEGVPGLWNWKWDPWARGCSFWTMPHRLCSLRRVLDQGNVAVNLSHSRYFPHHRWYHVDTVNRPALSLRVTLIFDCICCIRGWPACHTRFDCSICQLLRCIFFVSHYLTETYLIGSMKVLMGLHRTFLKTILSMKNFTFCKLKNVGF